MGLSKYLIIAAIIAALVGGSVIYIQILKSNLAACEAEKNLLVAELAVSQASVKGLQAAINEQNAAIETLKSEADKREKKHAAEIARAKAAAADSKKRADDILTRVVPQGKSACDAANDLFNEEIKNAKK